MARYFFNVYDGKEIYDNVGLEFPTVRAMRMHMLEVAMEIASTEIEQKDPWQMEVLDENGKIVCSMDFGLEIKGTD